MKEKLEYFQVKEVIKLKIKEDGDYAYFKLKKRNYNTIKAIEVIAKKLHINPKQIGFAGNKDKAAITTQYISIPKITSELNLKDISLKFIGCGDKRINLGDLIGNKFKIKFDQKLRNMPNFMENYFDEQRFGINHNNHILGKLIIDKKFKELDNLIENKSDYTYKLKLRFYFHAYQSYLFNEVLSEYLSEYENFKIPYSIGEFVFLKKEIKNFKVPLINFDTNLKGKTGRLYKKILKKEHLDKNSFLIRSHPFLVSDTQYRDVLVEVTELSHKKDYIYFTLPKGAYATIFIKKLELLNSKV